MASNTVRLKRRRTLSKTGRGKWRKSQARNHGSTPTRLPLDVPNAHEQAQQKSK